MHRDYVKRVRRVVPGSGCIETKRGVLLHIIDRFTLPPKCGAPHFGGTLRIAGFITEPKAVRKILDHLDKRNGNSRAPPKLD